MNIAVLLGGVGFDSQKRAIKGILDSAIPNGDNIYIFTCDGWTYESRYQYEDGEYNIYRLPDFTQYDGVIINSDTIHDLNVIDEIIANIRQAKIPYVSLNKKWEDSLCIQMENKSGISAVTRHLIEKHNIRNIYFVSGPANNIDAEERLASFKETMAEYHLDWNEDKIIYGDYTYQSGIDAAKEYLQSEEPLPDAIMAANDEMAVGIILTLEEAGIHVPQDILVTGYDNSEIAHMNHPRLTTVRRGERSAGELAYKQLRNLICNPSLAHDDTIYGKPIFSQSCGCEKKEHYTHAELQRMFVQKSVDNFRTVELLKNSGTEFIGLNSFDDFMECTKRYIRKMNPDYFYLCMCGSIENYYAELDRIAEGKERGRDTTVYKDDIWIPLAYEQGEFRNYGQYHKKHLLPPICKEGKKGNYYFIMPIHYQNYCFGYCIVGNYAKVFQDRVFNLFLMNLNNALENVRKQDMMKAILENMNRICVYDNLTGVYNRVGFRKYAPDLIATAKELNESITVLFADIDRLKYVNDTYGHEEGDFYIKSIATTLEKTCHLGEFVTRYGGDEFIVLLRGYNEESIQTYIEQIEKNVYKSNLLLKKPYIMDVSIGHYLEPDADKIDLEKVIEMADQNMYAIKQQKKAKHLHN